MNEQNFLEKFKDFNLRLNKAQNYNAKKKKKLSFLILIDSTT